MASVQRGTQSSLSEINMVPFVDVVLVLLIIFMITAPILQSGIELNVPKTHAVKETPEQRIVSLHRQATAQFTSATLRLTSTNSAPKPKPSEKDPGDAIFLRCDETVPFGVFASVVDALRVSGINNISIVTEPITERSKSK